MDINEKQHVCEKKKFYLEKITDRYQLSEL